MAKFEIVMQGSSFRTDQALLGICTVALIWKNGKKCL